MVHNSERQLHNAVQCESSDPPTHATPRHVGEWNVAGRGPEPFEDTLEDLHRETAEGPHQMSERRVVDARAAETAIRWRAHVDLQRLRCSFLFHYVRSYASVEYERKFFEESNNNKFRSERT